MIITLKESEKDIIKNALYEYSDLLKQLGRSESCTYVTTMDLIKRF